MRIAKADLVPTGANLLEAYRSFGQLEAACREFCEQVNARPHRETRRRPVEALAEERGRLHPLPAEPFTVAFGTTRRVNWDGTISVEGVRYSVPHELVDTRVWARFHGDELIVTAVGGPGPVEVARHARSAPGNPSIKDEHYPPRPEHTSDRTPKPTSAEEAAFLALGPGAASWLIEAAAAGTRRIRATMPKPSRWPSCTAAVRSTAPWGPRRSPAGSPTTTSSVSSPTRPAARSAHPLEPVRRTACNPAPAPGPASGCPPPPRTVRRDEHPTAHGSRLHR